MLRARGRYISKETQLYSEEVKRKRERNNDNKKEKDVSKY